MTIPRRDQWFKNKVWLPVSDYFIRFMLSNGLQKQPTDSSLSLFIPAVDVHKLIVDIDMGQ